MGINVVFEVINYSWIKDGRRMEDSRSLFFKSDWYNALRLRATHYALDKWESFAQPTSKCKSLDEKIVHQTGSGEPTKFQRKVRTFNGTFHLSIILLTTPSSAIVQSIILPCMLYGILLILLVPPPVQGVIDLKDTRCPYACHSQAPV